MWLLFCGHLFSFLCSDFRAQTVEYLLDNFFLTWVPRVQERGDLVSALRNPQSDGHLSTWGNPAGTLEKKRESKCKTIIILYICTPALSHTLFSTVQAIRDMENVEWWSDLHSGRHIPERLPSQSSLQLLRSCLAWFHSLIYYQMRIELLLCVKTSSFPVIMYRAHSTPQDPVPSTFSSYSQRLPSVPPIAVSIHFLFYFWCKGEHLLTTHHESVIRHSRGCYVCLLINLRFSALLYWG